MHGSNFGQIPFLMPSMAGCQQDSARVRRVKVQLLNQWTTAAPYLNTRHNNCMKLSWRNCMENFTREETKRARLLTQWGWRWWDIEGVASQLTTFFLGVWHRCFLHRLRRDDSVLVLGGGWRHGDVGDVSQNLDDGNVAETLCNWQRRQPVLTHTPQAATDACHHHCTKKLTKLQSLRERKPLPRQVI